MEYVYNLLFDELKKLEIALLKSKKSMMCGEIYTEQHEIHKANLEPKIEAFKKIMEVTKNLMWNQVDILLTADPILLLEKPVGKIVVKYNTSYNKHINSDYEIYSLSEFGELLKQLK
jgi:hypothetical protein